MVQFSELESKIKSLCYGIEDRTCALDLLTMESQAKQNFILNRAKLFGRLGSSIVTGTAMKAICHRINFPYRFWDDLSYTGKTYKEKESLGLMRDQLANRLISMSSDEVLLRTTFTDDIYGVNSLHYERINHDFVWDLLADNEVMADFNLVGMKCSYDYLSLKLVSKKAKNVDDIGTGFIITNSMSGLRALEIKGFVFIVVCSNGMIVENGGVGEVVRKIHKGRKMELGVQDKPDYSRDPKFEEIKELVYKQISYARSQTFNDKVLEKIDSAMHIDVLEEEEATRIHNILKLSEKEKERYNVFLERNIVTHGKTLWGYVQAATAMAHFPPFDETLRQEELEHAAWRVLETY
jgi:hypothetical protein